MHLLSSFLLPDHSRIKVIWTGNVNWNEFARNFSQPFQWLLYFILEKLMNAQCPTTLCNVWNSKITKIFGWVKLEFVPNCTVWHNLNRKLLSKINYVCLCFWIYQFKKVILLLNYCSFQNKTVFPFSQFRSFQKLPIKNWHAFGKWLIKSHFWFPVHISWIGWGIMKYSKNENACCINYWLWHD